MSYESAREQYAKIGVDTDRAIAKMRDVHLSMHCWQGDDVSGFEGSGELTGGIQVTGNYPGKARNGDELRADIEKVFSLVPGKHRVNLHAIYAETGGEQVERDRLKPEHFERWAEWARQNGLGLDFNPTFFSHPKSDAGFTLSSADDDIRAFWVEHGKACRRIGEYFGKQLGTPCVTNFWIPDGYKDIPVDRTAPRARLKESLDEIFAEPIDARYNIDAVESKVFGIGSESYVTGSHEFYMGYALKNKKLVCLDAGHFHPTESIVDKISALYQFMDEILLHVSRPVRWDSDHVVIYNDELVAIAQELVRGGYLDKTHIALDFFDGSINRIAAWTIGMRSTLKAILYAMLEPTAMLQYSEVAGDFTTRLAMLEELKFYPFREVWQEYCKQYDVPSGHQWIQEAKEYENTVLANR